MALSPENNDKASVRDTAERHVEEILARRSAARMTRAAALDAHPEPISTRTELVKGRLSAADVVLPSAVTTNAQTAGFLLAAGDSWFDYPIRDILTNLDDTYGYNIESAAHKGDAIEAMVSRVGQLDKLARCLDKIIAFGTTPKAILVSGGGNDIAGVEFGMLMNNIDLFPIAGLNDQIISGVIDTRIGAAYRLMFTSINFLCQKRVGRTFPIIVHGYAHPVPDGRGFLGGWGPFPGPWLKPGFDEKLFTDITATTQMMVVLIDRFNTMLQNLVAEPGFENVQYIDLRGTLSNNPVNYEQFWANELHPTGGSLFGNGADGFALIAAKFQTVLSQLP